MKQKIYLFSLLLYLSIGVALAQSIQIKGKVVDEKSEAVIGATIRLKDTPSRGTVTGVDGTFGLQAKKGQILIISYVGYKTQELAASSNMLIKLSPDQTVLDEVVFIGYMPRKVANTSASLIKLSGKELSSRPVANPLDAVQGKVTGLQINSSSGEPSAQLSIALHGSGSLGTGTGPLFIVDGMPVSANMVRAMNPNDMENVQFLKDAAATSIYGARAANGVVYITTKRGKGGEKAKISVRGQYAYSVLANTDFFEELMTAPELLRYYEETNLYTAQDLETLKQTTFKGTDFAWYKYVYQPAPLYSVDVSASGGFGKTDYYISAATIDQKGLRQGSSFSKMSARLNLNTSLSSKIRLGLNSSVSYDKSQTSPFGNNNGSGGGLAPLNPPFISPYDADTGEELEYIPLLNATTPKHVIPRKPGETSNFIFSGTANLTATLLPKLTYRSLVGVESNYTNIKSRVLPSYRNAHGIGSANRSYSSATYLSLNNTLSYLIELGRHNITALAGQEYINFSNDGFGATGSGLLDDRLTSLTHTTQEYHLGEDNSSYAFLSFFTQVSYDYKERYFADLVLRSDASSRFGANRRSGLFWSLGLLWKAKREKALQDLAWLNMLDLKVSYGTQGNASVPLNHTRSYAGASGRKEDKIGLGFVQLGNPDLSWERQSKFTIGFKARLWDRLDLNLEYYNRITRDMIFETPLSLSTGLPLGTLGYVVQYQNVGSILNHGIDLHLGVEILKGKDYGLSAYANFSYNRDKVLELFEGRQNWFERESLTSYIVGEPVTIMLPLYKGVNSQTGRPEWYLPGEDIGIPTRDDNRLVSEFSPNLTQNTGVLARPPINGGWGVEATWKGFYLNADFSYCLGKHLVSLDKQKFENDYYIRDKNANYNGSRRLFDYWKKPGDQSEFPSLEYVRANRQSHYTDSSLIENASFMRLKNLTIGYQLPKSLLGKRGFISSARIYFSGRNLLTFTSFRGIDPEVISLVPQGVNPNTKQFSLGAELTF